MTEDRYINPKNIDLKLGVLEADGELLIPLSAVRAAIAAAPSEDVVEQIEGEWEYHECVSSHDGVKSGYSCTNCRAFVDENIFDLDEFNKAFCGACGTKMKGGE